MHLFTQSVQSSKGNLVETMGQASPANGARRSRWWRWRKQLGRGANSDTFTKAIGSPSRRQNLRIPPYLFLGAALWCLRARTCGWLACVSAER